jgi:2-hydroxychromene-2-carboxylate isomerase
MTAPAPLGFWFEFASTYSYPAAERVEELAARAGCRVEWRPFLLGPIFAAQGWDDSPFNVYPAKGRYMWRDVARVCARQRLPFARPTRFPRNGLLAARVACLGAAEPWCPRFVRAVYRANFVSDRDIADRAVIEELLADAGVPGAATVERALAPANKERLREQTEEAVRLGIFGAPTFTVGAELFWGNDRLEDAIDAWRAGVGAATG